MANKLTTLSDLNTYFDGFVHFDYNYGCEINFYTNYGTQPALYQKINSNDYLPKIFLNEVVLGYRVRSDGFVKLFNTPNQYYGALYYWLREHLANYKLIRGKPPHIGFAEVYHTSPLGLRGFIGRYFIRHGAITPFISEVEDRAKCPYIRLELVKKSPTLNWKGIMMDSFWGKRKNISDYEFFKKI